MIASHGGRPGLMMRSLWSRAVSRRRTRVVVPGCTCWDCSPGRSGRTPGPWPNRPVLAQHMLDRLLDSRAEVGWFTADEAYGDNPGLRAWLEDKDLNYVMAVSCDTRFTTPTGPARADDLAAAAPGKGWQRLSAGL